MGINTRALKNKVVPFDWKPFSQQQLKVMTWWLKVSPHSDRDAIITDGSVRSGKTVSLAFSYVLWSMEMFNGQNFGMAGKTIYAFRRNVVKPLKAMLKSRNYTVVDVMNENMLIVKKGETINTYYIFGGLDESSQDTVQGITCAGFLFDEVALMPESFVNQCTARCSVRGAKFWFSCNPDSPFHWFKKQWIDKCQEKRVLYLHFTMDDNPSLDEATKERYKRIYTGVFYKRFILGMWVIADGVVYPMFDKEKHMITYRKNWTRTFVSIDFGMTNPTTFGYYGFYAPEKHYHLISTYFWSGKVTEEKQQEPKSVNDYVDDLEQFIREQDVKPEYVVVDPSAAPLIVEMRKRKMFRQTNTWDLDYIKIYRAKNSVTKGIAVFSYVLQTEQFTMDPSCIEDEEEFAIYAWDEKAQKLGKDEVVKTSDHCMDRNRYAVYTDSILNKTLDIVAREMVNKVSKGAILD